VTQPELKKNRRTLLLIAGIPMVILLGATWLWFAVSSGALNLVDMLGTANRGDLLSPPVSLEQLQAVDAKAAPFDPLSVDEPLWRILVPVVGGCDAACLELLHYTRQIHTALGKYKLRIERTALVVGEDQNAAWLQELARDYPKLKLLYTAPAPFAALTSALPKGGTKSAYYVVDPYGWVILAYAADEDGKDVMADLKFLLKNSNG
jgi:hypothetical protein